MDTIKMEHAFNCFYIRNFMNNVSFGTRILQW